jgi:hypothetical protein
LQFLVVSIVSHFLHIGNAFSSSCLFDGVAKGELALAPVTAAATALACGLGLSRSKDRKIVWHSGDDDCILSRRRTKPDPSDRAAVPTDDEAADA